jgi:hypothetical protein
MKKILFGWTGKGLSYVHSLSRWFAIALVPVEHDDETFRIIGLLHLYHKWGTGWTERVVKIMTDRIICKNQKLSITLICLDLIGLESTLYLTNMPRFYKISGDMANNSNHGDHQKCHEFHHTEIRTTYNTM